MKISELKGVMGAIEFHDRLNPSLWENYTLKPEVSERLSKIADFFIDFLDVEDLKVVDITVSGSNAAFTYTPKSDIDLHIVVEVDSDKQALMRNFFDAKKTVFNSQHEIVIKKQPVELYVQFSDQPHASAGIFSIMHHKWLSKPKKVEAKINDTDVQSKAKSYVNSITHAIRKKDIDAVNKIWDKIKEDRKEGLSKHGEFGTENLVFKTLRNAGFLELLTKFKKIYVSQQLSLENANEI
jgi:hypothetical protein